jgi:hypothetical protein
MAERITWKQGQYSITSGYVGGLPLFTIAWKTSRAAPDWTLQVDLPGGWEHLASDDKDALKQRAEAALVVFVERLGASFSEESDA